MQPARSPRSLTSFYGDWTCRRSKVDGIADGAAVSALDTGKLISSGPSRMVANRFEKVGFFARNRWKIGFYIVVYYDSVSRRAPIVLDCDNNPVRVTVPAALLLFIVP